MTIRQQRRVQFAWAWLLLVSLLLRSALAAPRAAAHYYFFKEPRELTLDPARVAYLEPAGAVARVGAATAAQAVTGDAPLSAFPVRGWTLAGIPVAQQDSATIQQRVAVLAADTHVAFASPVFVGLDGGPVIVTPDLLVRFVDGVSDARAATLLANAGAGAIQSRNWSGLAHAYRCRPGTASGYDVLNIANALAQLPEVEFAEPDMLFTGTGDWIPTDPGFGNAWGIHNTGQAGGTADQDMDGPEAWDITIGVTSIVVVVIDVGVQTNHPDILQRRGADFTSDGGDGGPRNSCDKHGTAVAGCVSAIISNGIGTAGIAPMCLTASARTFISNTNTCNGSWTSSSSWTVAALAWAESIGARVSNNSNGYGFQSSAIASKYASTRTNGMVHFASAGNNGSTTIGYPASLPDVNAVAALDRNGNLASFSDHGVGLDLSAPGASIYTPDRTGAEGYAAGDYATVSGTSFASPYAAGVAALVLSVNPGLSAGGVDQVMSNSAVDLGTAGYDTTFGYGFVNAYGAVRAATTTTTTTTTSSSTTTTSTTTSTTTTAAGTVTLAVQSPYGTASPPIGTNTFPAGSALTAAVTDSPVTMADSQSRMLLVCTGWTGAGSVPASGTGTQTGPFLLLTNSTLIWHWQLCDLALSNRIETATANHQASQSIAAGDGYRVESPADVSFQAGKTVRLQPGFTAATGSTFRAYIAPVP
ncbi:MAG: S8 family serine peptidase [Lentisphaerae bacterium]|nr:S8 family serine peptidase [Lentisphaerota bacterium]